MAETKYAFKKGKKNEGIKYLGSERVLRKETGEERWGKTTLKGDKEGKGGERTDALLVSRSAFLHGFRIIDSFV